MNQEYIDQIVNAIQNIDHVTTYVEGGIEFETDTHNMICGNFDQLGDNLQSLNDTFKRIADRLDSIEVTLQQKEEG